MPTGPRGEKRPVNPIEAGIMTARVAVGDIDEQYVEPPPKPEPNKAKGGQKGGKARARALTAEQRTEIATRAAQARWDKGEANTP